jgi:hypothetical protein
MEDQRFSACAIQTPSLLSGARDWPWWMAAQVSSRRRLHSPARCPPVSASAEGDRRTPHPSSGSANGVAAREPAPIHSSPHNGNAPQLTQQSRVTRLMRVEPSQLLQRRVCDERGAEVAQERRVTRLMRIESAADVWSAPAPVRMMASERKPAR